MQNNIKIRNLYIGKIQKQISKLTHSIQLLNNLNNVIIGQYGGSKIEEAKQLLEQQNVVKESIDFKSVSDAADNSIHDLKATINILTDYITKLKEDLASTRSTSEQNDLLQKIDTLEKDLIKCKTELTNKESQLITISDKTAKLEEQLLEYNMILEKLKKKLTIKPNTLIETFNNQVSALIVKLRYPSLLMNTLNKNNKINTKIQTKFNEVFDQNTRNSIDDKIKELETFKITTGPPNTLIGITPYVTKNQTEETTIKEYVDTYNKKYNSFITANKVIIDNITNFKYQYDRVNNVIVSQNQTKSLNDNFKDFNEYFNITIDDLQE